MVQKTKGRKIYRSMQGKQIDLDLLIKRNELTPAVGNARVNARGDELGPGGKIIRKREEVVKEYYQNNKPVADEIPVKKQKTTETGITGKELEDFESFDSDPVPEKKSSTKNSKQKQSDEWVEDEDGNFIKKGDE